ARISAAMRSTSEPIRPRESLERCSSRTAARSSGCVVFTSAEIGGLLGSGTARTWGSGRSANHEGTSRAFARPRDEAASQNLAPWRWDGEAAPHDDPQAALERDPHGAGSGRSRMNVAVVGAGAAGMTAALRAAEAGARVSLLNA